MNSLRPTRHSISALFLTLSFAVVAHAHLPSVVGTVYHDTDNDGLYTGDDGLMGVTVNLYEDDGDEIFNADIDQMITTAAKGGQAVIGLDATLKTVSEGRVQTLVISDGYRSTGFIDEQRSILSAYERVDSPFADDMIKMDDIVEAAVSRTMEQGGTVEVISDSDELEQAGQIGALLRY